jgi:hypothetical protein
VGREREREERKRERERDEKVGAINRSNRKYLEDIYDSCVCMYVEGCLGV